MLRDRTPPRARLAPTAVILIATAALTFGGCQGQSAHSPDPWARSLPRAHAPAADVAAELAAARPLDPSIVRLVLEPFQDEAERLLENVSWVQLTADDAARLAGWADAPEPDHLYLLRGLELPAVRTGGLRVTQSAAGDVLVAFEGLTHSADAGQTRRQPVVVMLDRPPRNVYVMTSVAG